MESDNIRDRISNIIINSFENKGLIIDSPKSIDLVDDGGMDSVTFISIIVSIEVEFGILIPNEILLMDNFRSLDKIAKIVEMELKKLT